MRRNIKYIIGGIINLLVEDNELNREIACELLGDAGLRIDEARDGKEAVEMLQEKGDGCLHSKAH